MNCDTFSTIILFHYKTSQTSSKEFKLKYKPQSFSNASIFYNNKVNQQNCESTNL